MEQTPLVTVLVTTYNQEKYIAQALDSVLAQKTDFPFEIYVSEDCGTDGTRTILQDYARRYPDMIRLNLRDKNVGISRNWYEGLCAARGEYVCTLEGDDWWLDDCKLQKQMNFLREHPDYAAVSHTIRQTDDAGNIYGCEPHDPRILGHDATPQLFLQGVTFSCTACLVKNLFRTPDAARERCVTANRSIADFALCMLFLDAGKVFVMDEPLSAYRVAGTDAAHQNYNATRSEVQKYCDFLSAVAACEEYFGDRYSFDTCRMAGTFFPYWNRIHDGGLKEFRAAMKQHLPASTRCRWPVYFTVRSAGLAVAALKRRLFPG